MIPQQDNRHKLGPKRALSEEEVLARKKTVLALPPSEDRSKELRRIKGQLRSIREFRKD